MKGRPMTGMLPLTERQSWKALQAHRNKIRDLHLRTLFVNDATRGERLTAEAVGIFLDYSKNRVTDETLALLCRLADESCLRQGIDAMFRGDKINVTENRAVLHVALRATRGTSIVVDGKDVVPEVHAVLDAMADFSSRVRSGAWTGHTGKRIRNVVNIGIGGSDLGPVMAYEALKRYSDRAMTFRFVSNVDGTDLVEAAATPWTRRSVCRRCSPWVQNISVLCWMASARWTSTSAPRRSSATCRCSSAC